MLLIDVVFLFLLAYFLWEEAIKNFSAFRAIFTSLNDIASGPISTISALFKTLFAALLCASACVTVQAQLRFEITGVGAKQLPIAVAAFNGDEQLAQPLADIIRADLVRSGVFRLLEAGNAALDENSEIKAADWRARGADESPRSTERCP